jgi:hypothetical protein
VTRGGPCCGRRHGSAKQRQGDANRSPDRPRRRGPARHDDPVGRGSVPITGGRYELIRIVVEMIGTDAVVRALEPRFQVRDDPMDTRDDVGVEAGLLEWGEGRIRAGGLEPDVAFEMPGPEAADGITAAYHARTTDTERASSGLLCPLRPSGRPSGSFRADLPSSVTSEAPCRAGAGLVGTPGTAPHRNNRRARYVRSRSYLNELRSPDSVRHVQPDCLPDRQNPSPRHAQIAPTNGRNVGSPLDQEIEGSNPSSPASYPTGSGPVHPDRRIWWLSAGRAWRGLDEGAPKCAEVHLIRLTNFLE